MDDYDDYDGPNWIAPTIGFPQRDPETGQMVIQLSFTTPMVHLNKFFDIINSDLFQRHFNAQLSEMVAEHFDDILASVEGIA